MKLVRMWFGLVLVALGVLGILDTVGVAEWSVTAGRWWPLAIIGLGLAAMWSQRRVSFGPGLLTVVGLVLLAGQLQWTQKTLFWPSLLLLAGAVALAGLAAKPVPLPAAHRIAGAAGRGEDR
ncbi:MULTISPECIES: LiaI-LiaF-like domain-containing protein [unclassified Amycolatopsis]|uniref:LiaF transmembrane domain-containing protein n=1 Tax=unclassified Amycolatopsis TaxID=2618356 RepID=UPI00210241B0|nr:DUF5668 domain-containing protein [Amycolatopsis sp. DSM 110486]